jgi:hypothetical protein
VKLLLAICLVLACLIVLPAWADAGFSARSAEVHACHARVDFNLLISSARNMSCRRAKRVMRHYRGSISYRFSAPEGFRCRRVSGNRLGGQWRCKKSYKAFRFEFGD